MAKNPKKRDCPALGKIIKRDDCGQNRISAYDCPPDCEFNPFAPANYSDLLEIEAQLDGRLAECLRLSPKLEANVDRVLRKAGTHAQPDLLIHDTFMRNIYFTPLEDGRSLAQTYLEDEARKLKNDTRILLRAKQQTRVSLLEVRDVLDGQLLRAVDLLHPEEGLLTMCDRAWAKRAARYDLGISWRYSLPHFERIAGVLSEWMDFDRDPLDVLFKISAYNGGPSELGDALDAWLLQNMELVNTVMHDAAYHRQRLIYEGMDAMLCRATYETTGDREELIGRLTMESDVDDDSEISDEERADGFIKSWDWFQPEGEAHPLFGQEARTLLGRIMLHREGRWRVEAFGEAKYVRLRSLFETCMDGKVDFSSERKDNIAGKTLGDHSPLSEESLKRIPPEFFETLPDIDMSQSRIPVDMNEGEAFSMVQMRERQLRTWIDEAIPKLDGATPREASADPEKRAELIRLVKPMIRSLDQDALSAGEVADIDWIYEALDLKEIQAAAPPLREAQAKQTFEGPALNREVLPPIPSHALTEMEDVYAMEDRVFDQLESNEPSVANSVMSPNCFAVMRVLREVITEGDEDVVEETMDLAQVMMPLVVMLIGTSELFEIDISEAELRVEAEEQIEAFAAATEQAGESQNMEPVDRWFAASRQPPLLKLMFMRIKEYGDEKPGAFSEDAFVPATLAICFAAALIDLLCRKLDRVPR